MPQQWRTRRLCLHPPGDLTIQDSADARQPVVRLRKSCGRMSSSSCSGVPDHWEDVTEEAAGEEVLWLPTRPSGRLPADDGRRYPPEIWDLVGQHVAPEDVSRFAAVCRDAYRTTLTLRFWVRLFWRWCAPPAPLAALAAPDFLHSRRGCRAAVIRALHQLHAPLRVLHRRAYDGTDTSRLVGAHCVNLGRAQAGSEMWLYCFVFRRATGQYHRRLAPPARRDVCVAREELFDNPDEGVTGLLVKAPGTSQLPAVFGQVVHSITVTMTTGMQQKMTLVFTQTGYKEGGSTVPAAYQNRTLVFAPIKNYRLVYWWDEEFQEVFHRHMISGKGTPS